MKKVILLCLIASLINAGCQKEKITLGNNVNETFYVSNKEAGMKVTVLGNTSSKVILLIVHGGPGGTASNYPFPLIKDKYAVAYWDQRIAGSSQGKANASSSNLATYVEDMTKVILTLKYRYGLDISVFVFGHSWGGMLSSAFVTTNNNQQLLKGWIYCEGVHNFPLLNSLVKDKLLSFGIANITRNKDVELWKPIVDYCNSLPPGNISADQSLELNNYADEAETNLLHDSPIESSKYTSDVPTVPFTSYALNNLNPLNLQLYRSLNDVELSSKLNKVTIPVFIVSGRYDFKTPVGLGDDLYARISSFVKTHLVLELSGHDVQQWDLTMSEILKFMDANK
jgi:pimeloyl-ACP methyl ester carboxylesterase